jgi:hypothetical protein
VGGFGAERLIIIVNEESVAGGATPALDLALNNSIAAARLGLHRLVVSPAALEALEGAGPAISSIADLKIVGAGWVEGQAAAARATNVIALTQDPARCGVIEGNVRVVHVNNLDHRGVLRTPSLVTESMKADGRYISALIRIYFALTDEETRRYFSIRLEQGGGTTIVDFVERHVREPNPLAIFTDRDNTLPAPPPKGRPGSNCAAYLVRQGYFADLPNAYAGGFSTSCPNLAFRILDAYSIENLVFPELMDLYFSEIGGHTQIQKRDLIRDEFPEFPNLSPEEALRWLNFNFRARKWFNSTNIVQLLNWSENSLQNKMVFGERAACALEKAHWRDAVAPLLEDIWSIGHRHKMLA